MENRKKFSFLYFQVSLDPLLSCFHLEFAYSPNIPYGIAVYVSAMI